MCDARSQSREESSWARLEEDPEMEVLLRDLLDNLVDLPERDEEYVRRQILAFANCVRQITAKDVLFSVSEATANAALAAPQDSLKRMRRQMDLQEVKTRSKTSGGSSTSDGTSYDGSNS